MTMSGGGTTWSFTYDANGMRTSRTNGTTTYSYVYNGSSLSQMTVGSNTLNFAYDASGTPMSVTYNGTNYYYVTNLQGDVVALLNSSGSTVVTYTYDAWGNILTASGSMAATLGAHNPLRYRGYVYDQETELYYLQSRYYDPQVGRFLIPDIIYDYDAGLQGFNLLAYCGNNPVNRIDCSGADSLQFNEEVEATKDEEERVQGTIATGGENQQSHSISTSPGHRVDSTDYSGTSGRTEVHHVVEQCQSKKSGFSNSQIQSDSNKVVLDYGVHRLVSGHYSSKQRYTEGLRVRDWLAGKPFSFQTEYGWKVVNYYYNL